MDPDGKAQVLPPDLYALLGQVLGDLKAGKLITILESNAELTTMEAARLLAVSRQFLIQLLEHDQIPFHMVGTHRRVYAREVLAFRLSGTLLDRRLPVTWPESKWTRGYTTRRPRMILTPDKEDSALFNACAPAPMLRV